MDVLIKEAMKCNVYRKEHENDASLCLDDIIKYYRKDPKSSDTLKLLKEVLQLVKKANAFKEHENNMLTQENNKLKEQLMLSELTVAENEAEITRYRWLKQSREHLICIFQIDPGSWDKIIDNQLGEKYQRKNRK